MLLDTPINAVSRSARTVGAAAKIAALQTPPPLDPTMEAFQKSRIGQGSKPGRGSRRGQWVNRGGQYAGLTPDEQYGRMNAAMNPTKGSGPGGGLRTGSLSPGSGIDWLHANRTSGPALKQMERNVAQTGDRFTGSAAPASIPAPAPQSVASDVASGIASMPAAKPAPGKVGGVSTFVDPGGNARSAPVNPDPLGRLGQLLSKNARPTAVAPVAPITAAPVSTPAPVGASGPTSPAEAIARTPQMIAAENDAARKANMKAIPDATPVPGTVEKGLNDEFKRVTADQNVGLNTRLTQSGKSPTQISKERSAAALQGMGAAAEIAFRAVPGATPIMDNAAVLLRDKPKPQTPYKRRANNPVLKPNPLD